MLTQAQIRQYQEQGYTVCPGLVNGPLLAAMHAEIDRIGAGQTLAAHDAKRVEMEPDQPPDGTRIRRIYEPCTYYPLFRQFSESPELLACVEPLIGPDIDFHYSKINMKPPAIGSVVEWHQDLMYYPLTNLDSVTVLVYLDDADRGNGCLQVIPGPPGGTLLPHTRDGVFQGRVTEPVDAAKAVPLEGAAGTVILMHALTPHASTVNRSPRWRRTLILSYRAADAFPLFFGPPVAESEQHVRHVRGRVAAEARCTWTRFPVPRYPRAVSSLYDLQEYSRASADDSRGG